MLQPKKIRWRKHHKELSRIRGKSPRGASLNFGKYGLKAMEPGRITARQIEAARITINRHVRRQGRVWIRMFPDLPVSKKPAEVRMG
ncbi:MAG: 50S ribosomal protein L16, partial [Mariprofundaceae bacterium]